MCRTEDSPGLISEKDPCHCSRLELEQKTLSCTNSAKGKSKVWLSNWFLQLLVTVHHTFPWLRSYCMKLIHQCSSEEVLQQGWGIDDDAGCRGSLKLYFTKDTDRCWSCTLMLMLFFLFSHSQTLLPLSFSFFLSLAFSLSL